MGTDTEANRHRELVELIEQIASGTVGGPCAEYMQNTLQDISDAQQLAPDRLGVIWRELLLSCATAVEGTGPTPADAAVTGESFADDGRTLSDSLQVVQDLRRTAIECLRRVAIAGHLEESFVIAGIGEISKAMNDYMLQFSTGYFRAEAANRSRQDAQQNEFVAGVLSGAGPGEDAFNRLGSYGLDSTAPYRAFRAHPESDTERRHLEALFQLSGQNVSRGGVSANIDGDLCGFVKALPHHATPIILVGVSEPVAFAELPAAFRRATRAFHVAHLAGRGGIQSLDSLGILASVMTDRDIAAELSRVYLEPLRAMGEYGDVILDTVRHYVENDGQIEAAAQDLGLHVNTVRYRITKFEEIIGVSLRDTPTLAEVWWALHLPSSATAGDRSRLSAST